MDVEVVVAPFGIAEDIQSVVVCEKSELPSTPDTRADLAFGAVVAPIPHGVHVREQVSVLPQNIDDRIEKLLELFIVQLGIVSLKPGAMKFLSASAEVAAQIPDPAVLLCSFTVSEAEFFFFIECDAL